MRKLPFSQWLFGAAILLLLTTPAFGDFTGYLPPMPPGSGIFGTTCLIVNPENPPFAWPDGIYWPNSGYYAAPNLDDPTAYVMDPVTDYLAPSPMEGKTPGPGDLLDYNFVWVNGTNNYAIWDMGSPAGGVRIYPCLDHPDPTELTSDVNQYNVLGSNDQLNWVAAIWVETYIGDLNNIRTHDGVKDYGFPISTAYRYIKIQPIQVEPAACDFEIDALEMLPPSFGGGVQVTIDIRPHSFANMINSKSRGLVQVAIFGSPTFDVTQIDPATIRIGDASLAQRGKIGPLMYNYKKVNKDPILDMVVFFNIPDLAKILPPRGGTEALTLTGKLKDGTSFWGIDKCHVPPGPSPLPKK